MSGKATGRAAPPRLRGASWRGRIGLALALAAIAAADAAGRGALADVDRREREGRAIGALKELQTAQSLFREADAEGDGVYDYAQDLHELGAAGLIDPDLARGARDGYRFTVDASPTKPEFLWLATASPLEPGVTGDHYFATNHTGVIHYTLEGPHPDRTEDCAVVFSGAATGHVCSHP